MDNDALTGVCFLVAVVATLGLGLISGMEMGKTTATKETTIYCIEHSKECKIEYDFYRLSENKK